MTCTLSVAPCFNEQSELWARGCMRKCPLWSAFAKVLGWEDSGFPVQESATPNCPEPVYAMFFPRHTFLEQSLIYK